MNKVFLALLFVAASFSDSIAQSMLKVRLSDNSPITVSVDGRYFNKRGTSITVGDLPYGNHLLKIYGISRYRYGRSYQEIIYSGRVRTYRGMTTFVTYNTYTGRVNIYEQEIPVYNRNNPPGNRNFDDNYNRYNDQPSNDANRNYNDNNNIPEDKQERAMPDNTDNTIPESRADEPIDNTSASPSASPVSPAPVHTGTLSDSKADKLKIKVNAKATDTEKLKELKEALKKERITTYQVSFMMDWFSFESTKVDFAKWAYDLTVDPENYSDLAQKFTFKNSEEELNNFIKSKQ